VGADFEFAARVSVVPSLSVSAASTGGSTSSKATLSMYGTQDQCLDVRWVDDAGAALDLLSSASGESTSDLFRLDGRGRGTVATRHHDAPAGATVQITLN